jgi:ATP-dependent DNA ligase
MATFFAVLPNFRDLLFAQRQATFIAFDVLYLNGRDLRTLPDQRKAVLEKLIHRKRARMFYLDHVTGLGENAFWNSGIFETTPPIPASN